MLLVYRPAEGGPWHQRALFSLASPPHGGLRLPICRVHNFVVNKIRNNIFLFTFCKSSFCIFRVFISFHGFSEVFRSFHDFLFFLTENWPIIVLIPRLYQSERRRLHVAKDEEKEEDISDVTYHLTNLRIHSDDTWQHFFSLERCNSV